MLELRTYVAGAKIYKTYYALHFEGYKRENEEEFVILIGNTKYASNNFIVFDEQNKKIFSYYWVVAHNICNIKNKCFFYFKEK